MTIEKEKEDRPRGSGKSSGQSKRFGLLRKRTPKIFSSLWKKARNLFCVVVVGISRNEEMMSGYEPCFCKATCWKEKKKRHSLAVEEMRDKLIDGCQKLKKKGDENGNGLCWWEKSSREILPHFPWFHYEDV